jgi:hypothetical protein
LEFLKIGLHYNFPAFIIVVGTAFFIVFSAVTFVVIWFPKFRNSGSGMTESGMTLDEAENLPVFGQRKKS